MPCAPPRRVDLGGLALLLIVALGVPGCRRDAVDWLADLEHGDPFVRTLAVVALGRADGPLPPPVGAALVQALQDPSAEVRSRAAESLRRHARELLRHEQPAVAAAAAAALDGRDQGSRALLLEALAATEPSLRSAAATSLAPAARGSEVVRAGLLAACRDEHEIVAAAARAALVPALVARLSSPQPDVAARAAGQLDELGAEGLAAVADVLAGGDPSALLAARDWLSARGSSAIAPLLSAFCSPTYAFDVELLRRLERCLLGFGAEALPPLLAELASPAPQRRAAAAAALAGLRASARPAAPALLAALDDEVETVRIAAAHALLHVGIEDGATLHALVERGLADSDVAGQHILGVVAASLVRPASTLDVRQAEALWLRLEVEAPRAAWLDVLATDADEPELAAAARAALEGLPAR